ncbi:A/G-specific adenine glycosylase [Eubacteriaceae bacterium ES3]|nr:A/G-specific adenine glycosylase [Eubacteriaceae bacterium ES3]
MPYFTVPASVILILQNNTLEWFYKNKRSLPFRETKNPYNIWISEIMAQQTQIDTLIPYYNRFIEKFPDLSSLAAANEADVLKAWEGLGYYSRARNLHKAAQIIERDYSGSFPSDYNTLIKLPGIGPYTGGAIASIAFNQAVTAVDGNVLRVISRFLNSKLDIGENKTKKHITQWLESLLPENSGDFNEALMELGAMICTPKSPKCLLCPLIDGCQAYLKGTQEILPLKKKKNRQKTINMEVGVLCQNQDLLFVRRDEKGLLSGMWSFPIIPQGECPGQAIRQHLNTYFKTLPEPKLAGHSRHIFTHIIWEIDVYIFRSPASLKESAAQYKLDKHSQEQSICFIPINETDRLTLPVAFKKLLPLISQ